MMQKFAQELENLDWIILLILTILVDGLVGGVIRVGSGRQTVTKVIGWVQLVSFIVSIVSFLTLPPLVGWIARMLCFICWICDVYSVAVYHRIQILAD